MKSRAKGHACRQPDPYRVPRKLRQRGTVKIVPVKAIKTSVQNMQSKTQLIVVLLGSIAFGLLSFFGYSPDPKIIGDTINYADQAKEAISMKNWISLATVLISFGALLFAWWKGRSNRQTLSIFLLLAISFAASTRLAIPTMQVSATTTDTDTDKANSIKIEVIKPLSKMDYWRRC